MAGMFDDLIPGNEPEEKPEASTGMFDDLIPSKGSYFSGDQGLVPDVAEEIGKGIYTGAVSLPQGIAELGAMGIDAVFDTDTSRDVTAAFEYIKPEVTSTTGQVTEGLVSFGLGFIPVAGWIGKAGQAAKLAKAGKLTDAKKLATGKGKFTQSAVNFGTSKAGQTALSNWGGRTGAYALGSAGFGFAVSTDGRATLSDNFSILPGQELLQTEKDTGLTGREEAGRRFRNRLRTGVEDGILSGAFDTLLKGGAEAAKAAGRSALPAAQAAGRSKVGRTVAQGAVKVQETAAQGFVKGMAMIGADSNKVVDTMSGAKRKFKEYFYASGGADQRLYETVEDARARSDMFEKNGVEASLEFKKASDAFIKSSKIAGSPTKSTEVEEALNLYLLGDYTALDKFNSPAMTKAADRMINVRSELEERLMSQLEAEIGLETKPTGETIRDFASGKDQLKKPTTPREQKAYDALIEMRRSQKAGQGYLRRVFQQYTDPKTFYKNLDLDDPLYQQAVNEVAIHTAGSMGKAVDDPTVIANAKNVVNESLGLGAQAGLPPELAIKNIQDGVADSAGALAGTFVKSRPKFTVIDDLFVPQKEIVTASPSLRALKGQLTDPMEVYKRTIIDMANTSVAADLYQALAAPTSGFADDLATAVQKIAQGGRPIMVNVPDIRRMTDEQYQKAMQPFAEMTRSAENVAQPVGQRLTKEDLVERYKQSLTKAGYVPLGDNADINHVFTGTYGNLTGTFVAPETYSSLTAPLRLNSGFLGEAAGIMSYARSLSQKMTIVPNPGAQVRNIAGNMGMLAGNANLGRETDFSDVFKLFTSNLDRLDEQGLNRLARVIALTGVEDTSLVTKALKTYKEAGKDLRFAGKLQAGVDSIVDRLPLMQFFENLYTNSDSFFKGVALLAEQDKLMNAMRAAEIPDNSPKVLEALKENGLALRGESLVNKSQGLEWMDLYAAEIVKDTMPIYPRVGKAVRALDAVPIFGNFVSFASENIRNSVNTVNRGLKEMAFEISPAIRKELGEAQSAALEQQIRGMGAQRVASYISVATIIPQSMTRASMMATGTTEEEMDALRSQVPEYLDGHDFVILDNDKKGKIDYIDLSYVSPYAFVLDPAKAALQRYHQAGKLGKNEAQQIAEGAFRGLEMFAEPFGEESMIYERLRDVLPSSGIGGFGVGRGGRSPTGAFVYRDTDDIGTKVSKGVTHIFGGIIPAYAELGVEVRGGKFEPGRVTRAMTGTSGPRGETYNAFKEGARLVTGFTPMRLDTQNDFSFKGIEYGTRRTDAKSGAQSVLKRADASLDEMNEAWSTYLDNLYREQSKLYADVQAARTLGLSDDDIRRNLINGAKLGKREANAIIDGRFEPGEATSELAKEINRLRQAEGRVFEEETLYFDTFNQMSQDRTDQPLRYEGQEPVAPVINFDDLIPQQQETPVINFDDLIPQRQGSILPAPAVPTGQAKLSPSLLGDNPIDVARNMEIATASR
jgi:hypothetical protein